MARTLRWLKAEVEELLSTLRTRAAVLGSMVLLFVLYLAGLVLPQANRIPPQVYGEWRAARPWLVRFLEWSGLIDVYASPLMVVALGAFFASLFAVLWDRIPRLLRRLPIERGLPLEPRALAGRKGLAELTVGDGRAAVARAAARLEAHGYRLWRPGEGALRAVRFRLAPLGFLLFHGSFALILAAGMALDLTRYSATVAVAEGEPFELAKAKLEEPPRLPRLRRPPPRVALTLLDVRAVSDGATAESLEAEVLLAGEAQPRKVIVNEPIRLGTTTILLKAASPVPLLTCSTAAGGSDGAFLKLATTSVETRAVLAGCSAELVVRAVLRDQSGGSEPATVRDLGGRAGGEALLEALEVTVRTADGEVARGRLLPGGNLPSRDGTLLLAMPEVRLQAHLQIVDEWGGALLAVGFLVALVGLLARLVFFRREIVVVHDSARSLILVAATSDAAGAGAQGRVLDAVLEAMGGERAGPANPDGFGPSTGGDEGGV